MSPRWLLVPLALLSARAEASVRMATFFQGVQPALRSAYSRVARESCAALDAGLLAEGDVLHAAFHETGEVGNAEHLKMVSSALDFFHTRLTSDFGGETAADDLDLDFVAEGRRLLAIQSYQVLEDADAVAAAACCLGEISRLVDGKADVGALVLLPGFKTDVAVFTDEFLREPLAWLGLDARVSVDAMRETSGAPMPLIRLFHGLSSVPPPVEVTLTRLTAREIVEGLGDDS
jgi:hypothetical protein